MASRRKCAFTTLFYIYLYAKSTLKSCTLFTADKSQMSATINRAPKDNYNPLLRKSLIFWRGRGWGCSAECQMLLKNKDTLLILLISVLFILVSLPHCSLLFKQNNISITTLMKAVPTCRGVSCWVRVIWEYQREHDRDGLARSPSTHFEYSHYC